MVATLESRVRQTDVPLFPPTSRWKQGHICGGERLDSVVEDREEIVITRAGHDPVVIVSLTDFESLRETAYLMGSPICKVADPGPQSPATGLAASRTAAMPCGARSR